MVLEESLLVGGQKKQVRPRSSLPDQRACLLPPYYGSLCGARHCKYEALSPPFSGSCNLERRGHTAVSLGESNYQAGCNLEVTVLDEQGVSKE